MTRLAPLPAETAPRDGSVYPWLLRARRAQRRDVPSGEVERRARLGRPGGPRDRRRVAPERLVAGLTRSRPSEARQLATGSGPACRTRGSSSAAKRYRHWVESAHPSSSHRAARCKIPAQRMAAIAAINAPQSRSETPEPTINVDRGDQRRPWARLTSIGGSCKTITGSVPLPILP